MRWSERRPARELVGEAVGGICRSAAGSPGWGARQDRSGAGMAAAGQGRAKPDLVSWRRLERARGDRPDTAHSSCYGRGRNNAKHCGRRPMFCR